MTNKIDSFKYDIKILECYKKKKKKNKGRQFLYKDKKM